jgi:hypothetical protein
MHARRTLLQLAKKAGMLFGSLFVVTVLLAAIPSHRPPAVQASESQESASTAQENDRNASPDANLGDEKASEKAAVEEMNSAGDADAHSPHMTMTAMRPEASGDVQRASEIVQQLRAGIEKYKDYHVALDDGFKIFLPNVPQPEYHFTSYKNGFLEAFTFDPARPTSLLYKKTSTGYQLVGAMYTMPKRATEDQLNERVPLSIAMWHLHTNLCIPGRGQFQNADWTQFGLHGAIATKDACDAAGGRFSPVIFGWMVHVYPYEDSLDKIFAMHMHRD